MNIFIGKIDGIERDRIKSLWLETWQSLGVKFNPSFLEYRNSDRNDVTDFVIYDESGSIAAGARLIYYQNLVENAETKYFFEEFKKIKTPFYMLNGCFAAQKFQGRNLSKALDRERILFSRNSKCQRILCLAVGEKRKETFERLGFRLIAENRNEVNIFLGGVPIFLMEIDSSETDKQTLQSYGAKVKKIDKLPTKDFSELNILGSHNHRDLR